MASTSGRKSAFSIYALNPPTITEAETTTPEKDKPTPKKAQTVVARRSFQNQPSKRKSNQFQQKKNKRPNIGKGKSGLLNATKHDTADVDQHVPEMIVGDRVKRITIQNTANGSIMIHDLDADDSLDEEFRNNTLEKARESKKKLQLGRRPSLPPSVQFNNENMQNLSSGGCGNEVAENIFNWLIHPLSPSDFFDNIFEQQPYYLKRENATYFEGLYSSKDFEKIVKENNLHTGIQMDITAYVGGERNPTDIADTLTPSIIWEYFSDGFTLRMRNPQVYHKGLWKTCSLLQEYFSSSVGANMYLTPPNTQGFPPHWDDIDAFILQIEGTKHWKVYHPSTRKDMLPRYSSGDLKDEDLDEPCLEIDVVPGDLLYIPRGFVHEAFATEELSLHLTISTNQLNTWADFFEKALPKALKSAAAKNVSLRRSLPKDFYEHVGVAFAPVENEEESPTRQMFKTQAFKHLQKICNHFNVDEAADTHAEEFIHSCMPPSFSKSEADLSFHGNGFKFENGEVKLCPGVKPETKVRWIRRRAIRLIMDESGCHLSHTLSNNKNSKEDPLITFPLEEWAVPAVSYLFKKHPEFVAVIDLPLERSLDERLQFAQQLYDSGLLMTEEALERDE
ncbi:hypothetical protein JTE90_015241 [Oedothorax gibbosus]|uniref:Bifunctional lysine-specific demethylase and histidyl-hydroxylase n=1 Tax=Oedothorax gibbosus TaxID=931172 RepID=A0AAV6TYH1_9ARAC|nr:hypothetical protein JTE90_015241 [Oedothorax gibbosus]